MKKLLLNRESLAVLRDQEAEAAQGGLPRTATIPCTQTTTNTLRCTLNCTQVSVVC